MKNTHFSSNYHHDIINDYLGKHLKNKSADCVLYSQDGGVFKIFKELFCQTDFLRQILSSTSKHCCNTIEILCPCSNEELGYLIDFLMSGEIQCENLDDCWKIQENLQKIFGYPKDLNFSNLNTEKVFETRKHDLCQNNTIVTIKNEETSSLENNIEIETEEDEQFENVSDLTNRKEDQGKVQNTEFDIKIAGSLFQKSKRKKIEKKCICNYCDSSFLKKSHLQVHINRVHLKLKPFQCKDCKKCFAIKVGLQRHIDTIHLKSKPFLCEICKKYFPRNDKLKMHGKTVHMNLKPFQCEICEKWFSEKFNLKTHVNGVHSNLKPFKCECCKKCFATKIDLQRHVDGVHIKLKPFHCELCQKSFFYKGNLQKHVIKVHSNLNLKKM